MTGAEAVHHRLPSADAAWLHMDRPTNLMVINSVMLFEQRVDEARLREVIRERLVEPYPRFRERVVESRLPLLGPSFEPDPHFELNRHFHRLGLPGRKDSQVDDTALQELLCDLIATPLDRSKPLWDIYLIDRSVNRQALLTRMHHCIADGIALARVMFSLTDTATQAEGFAGSGPERPSTASKSAGAVLLGAAQAPVKMLAKPVAGALGAGARTVSATVHEAAHTMVHPSHVGDWADRTAADAQALAKLLFSPAETDSPLRGKLGVSRRVAWTEPLDLARVKATAHAQSATVNDVLLASVSGALRRHMGESGRTPQEVRVFVPFNLRALDQPLPRELGNRFGLVFLSLPVDIRGRRARLGEIKRRMDAIKNSPEGPISYAILEAVGLTPPLLESRIVDIFTAKASAVMTNVPGPSEVVYLAGAPVRTVLVWAPTSGSVGISVSIFSYRGEVTIGLLSDRDLVADPQRIMRHTEQEFEALARLKP